MFTGEADQSPPVVTSITPDFMRVGATRDFRISGSGLLGATVSSVDPNLTARVVAATATDLTVRLIAAAGITPGPRAITVSNAAGFTEAAVSVRPALTFSTVPSHIAVPPDSVGRPLTIRMADSDPAPVTLTLAVSDTSVASVFPPSVVFESGQTEAQITVTGHRVGWAYLNVAFSAFEQPTRFVVFVNNDRILSTGVRVVLTPPPPAPVSAAVGPLLTQEVRLVKEADETQTPKSIVISPVLTPTVRLMKETDQAEVPASTLISPVLSPNVSVTKEIE